MHTDKIDFLDVTLCYHRVNRPGQTMASTGAELAAFFDHFQTIQGYLTAETPADFRTQSIAWVLGNMSWHLARLQPEAAPQYFRKAEAACVDFVEADLPKEMVNSEASLYAILLQERGWGAALDHFLAQHNRKELRRIYRSIADVKNMVREQVHPIRSAVVALRNTTIYDTLYDGHHARSDTEDPAMEWRDISPRV